MTRLPQETENWALINAIDESTRWMRVDSAAACACPTVPYLLESAGALLEVAAAHVDTLRARAVSPTLGAGNASGASPRSTTSPESWTAVADERVWLRDRVDKVEALVAESHRELAEKESARASAVDANARLTAERDDALAAARAARAECDAALAAAADAPRALEASNKRFQRAARDDAFRRDKLVADSRHKLAEKESAHASAVETMRDGSKTAAEIVNPMMDENDSLMYENASLKARDQEREREFVALERKNDDLRAEVERLTSAPRGGARRRGARRGARPAPAPPPKPPSPVPSSEGFAQPDEECDDAGAPASPEPSPKPGGRGVARASGGTAADGCFARRVGEGAVLRERGIWAFREAFPDLFGDVRKTGNQVRSVLRGEKRVDGFEALLWPEDVPQELVEKAVAAMAKESISKKRATEDLARRRVAEHRFDLKESGGGAADGCFARRGGAEWLFFANARGICEAFREAFPKLFGTVMKTGNQVASVLRGEKAISGFEALLWPTDVPQELVEKAVAAMAKKSKKRKKSKKPKETKETKETETSKQSKETETSRGLISKWKDEVVALREEFPARNPDPRAEVLREDGVREPGEAVAELRAALEVQSMPGTADARAVPAGARRAASRGGGARRSRPKKRRRRATRQEFTEKMERKTAEHAEHLRPYEQAYGKAGLPPPEPGRTKAANSVADSVAAALVLLNEHRRLQDDDDDASDSEEDGADASDAGETSGFEEDGDSHMNDVDDDVSVRGREASSDAPTDDEGEGSTTGATDDEGEGSTTGDADVTCCGAACLEMDVDVPGGFAASCKCAAPPPSAGEGDLVAALVSQYEPFDDPDVLSDGSEPRSLAELKFHPTGDLRGAFNDGQRGHNALKLLLGKGRVVVDFRSSWDVLLCGEVPDKDKKAKADADRLCWCLEDVAKCLKEFPLPAAGDSDGLSKQQRLYGSCTESFVDTEPCDLYKCNEDGCLRGHRCYGTQGGHAPGALLPFKWFPKNPYHDQANRRGRLLRCHACNEAQRADADRQAARYRARKLKRAEKWAALLGADAEAFTDEYLEQLEKELTDLIEAWIKKARGSRGKVWIALHVLGTSLGSQDVKTEGLNSSITSASAAIYVAKSKTDLLLERLLNLDESASLGDPAQSMVADIPSAVKARVVEALAHKVGRDVARRDGKIRLVYRRLGAGGAQGKGPWDVAGRAFLLDDETGEWLVGGPRNARLHPACCLPSNLGPPPTAGKRVDDWDSDDDDESDDDDAPQAKRRRAPPREAASKRHRAAAANDLAAAPRRSKRACTPTAAAAARGDVDSEDSDEDA
ncbi:hypothetical protein SO694_00015213 [Aureococcus anophagefferens]|uniref:R3H domain-containing protein n=1 Tax=Aureococcus anophagefferens TaxID=44056 RepID=A0ABR1G2D1_AURAN